MSTQPTSPKFDIIEWMTEHGHSGYATEISDLERKKADLAAVFSNTSLVRQMLTEDYNKQIEEIRQEAQDRYDDWASDPLP